MAIELMPGVHRLIYRQVDEVAFQAYLVEADVPTLIDAAPGDRAAAYLEAVRSTEQTPERLILTADDPAVVPTVAALRDEYGLEVWAPVAASFDGALGPDRRFADGDEIGPFLARSIAGRYALHDADGGLVAASGTLVGSDARGLPPGYLLPPPVAESEGAAAEWGLHALLERPFEAVLVAIGEPVLRGADGRLAAFLDAPIANRATVPQRLES